MNLYQKILKFLTKKLLYKINQQYCNQYQIDLPIVAITGNIGKSSQTLILNQVFAKAGFNVISGTSLDRGLNSLSGVAMTLCNYSFSLEGKNKLQKVWILAQFLLYLVIRLFFVPVLRNNSIFIYEIGYDHQGESAAFLDLFASKIDLVVTNLDYEHTGGFAKQFDIHKYEDIITQLPKTLQDQLLDSTKDSQLKNIAMEQLTLYANAKTIVLPKQIGMLENVWYLNNQIQETKAKIENFELFVNDIAIDKNFLLPITIAKNFDIAVKLVQQYKPEITMDILKNLNLQLPKSRFNKLKGINDSTIIDSTYNSDPASMQSFLQNLEQVIVYYKDSEMREKANIINPPFHQLIIGEMRELGTTQKAEHVKILTEICAIQKKYPEIESVTLIGKSWLELDSDDIVKTGQNSRIIRFLGQNINIFDNPYKINQSLKLEEIRKNDWFWVKGSQNTIFLEVVVEHLLQNKIDKKYLCRQSKSFLEVKDKLKL